MTSSGWRPDSRVSQSLNGLGRGTAASSPSRPISGWRVDKQLESAPQAGFIDFVGRQQDGRSTRRRWSRR
jgi:hypothetical protein